MTTRDKNENENLVPNGDFQAGRIGARPEEWRLRAASKRRAPVFQLVRHRSPKVLQIQGNGEGDCYGYLASSPIVLAAGQTYRFHVRFRISPAVNPQWNLRFSFYAKEREEILNNGIFRFRRGPGGIVEGENRFPNTAGKDVEGEVRIYYAHHPAGKVFVEHISLSPCEPVPPRWVKVAATGGRTDLDEWARVLDAAGEAKADLVLLPEEFRLGEPESRRGPSPALLAAKARQYGMYTAGGFYLKEKGRVYNTCMLFDRRGRLAGRYDKIHPYTPELWRRGIVPGREAPVFQTDFGKVGIVICYDSWFPDVAELLALKGAEILLFPNASYFRSLMPARAADNGVRFVVSSLDGPPGIWDTAGRDIADPLADPTNHAGVPLETTIRDMHRKTFSRAKMLLATYDLSQSPSPHNWGGPCLSAPGGRRNRREQLRLLYDEIRQEQQRWWEE